MGASWRCYLMIVVQTVVKWRIRVEAKSFEYKYRPLFLSFLDITARSVLWIKGIRNSSTLQQLPYRQAKSSMQLTTALLAALAVVAVSAGVIEERDILKCGGKNYNTQYAWSRICSFISLPLTCNSTRATRITATLSVPSPALVRSISPATEFAMILTATTARAAYWNPRIIATVKLMMKKA